MSTARKLLLNINVPPATLRGQIKMAKVVVTLKIMPEDPEVNLDELSKKILKKIQDFAGKTETKVEKEPIGFGLNALKIFFVMDESKGGTEKLEETISQVDGVNSVEAVDVRRTIG